MTVLKINSHHAAHELKNSIDNFIEKLDALQKNLKICGDIHFVEIILFGLAVYRAVWLGMFDVTSPQLFEYLYSRNSWVVLFSALASVQVTAFLICPLWRHSAWLRAGVLAVYASAWFILGILALIAHYESPAFGNFLAYVALSIWQTVGIIRGQFRQTIDVK